MSKNKYFKSIILLLSIIILALSLVACAKPESLPKGDYEKIYEREIPKLYISEEGDFRVLQLTDLHLGVNESKDKKTLEGISSILSQKEYNLVVVSGDMLEGFNNSSKFDKLGAINAIARLFEEKKQYWTYVAGNNDGEYCGGNEDIIMALAPYNHCILGDTKGVDGTGNFFIPILNNKNNEVHRIVLVDSRMRNEKGKLMSIDKTQTDWYDKISKETKEKNIFMSLFMHIPFTEYTNAYKVGEKVASYHNNFSENPVVNNDTRNDDLYQIISANGNTGIVATGHTHSSDYARFYKEMYWLAVRSCGYYAYANKNLNRGGAEITIHANSQSIRDAYTLTAVDFV